VKKLLYTFLLVFSFGGFLKAQNDRIIEFSGTIRNDSLAPLPFVSIYITNRSTGIISNFDGTYALNARPKDKLVFSCVGYKRHFYTVPDTIKSEMMVMNIVMKSDTFMLDEATVFPWKTYEQFKEAVLNYQPEDKDLENAKKNIEIMMYQAQLPAPMSAASNYRYYINSIADKNYYRGQLQPNNYLNPIAWAKFFELLNKNKNKKDKGKYD
jgi:hypothetical protein